MIKILFLLFSRLLPPAGWDTTADLRIWYAKSRASVVIPGNEEFGSRFTGVLIEPATVTQGIIKPGEFRRIRGPGFDDADIRSG